MVPRERRSLVQFNEQVYTGKDRSSIYGTIVRYPKTRNGQDVLCFELPPSGALAFFCLRRSRDRLKLSRARVEANRSSC
jgi:hypothetical protein